MLQHSGPCVENGAERDQPADLFIGWDSFGILVCYSRLVSEHRIPVFLRQCIKNASPLELVACKTRKSARMHAWSSVFSSLGRFFRF